MSHMEAQEKSQHRDVKCFSGDSDALDGVRGTHDIKRCHRERSDCNAPKRLGHRCKEERDGELKLDLQHHGKMFQGFAE